MGLEHLFHPAEACLTAGDNAAILSGIGYAAFPHPRARTCTSFSYRQEHPGISAWRPFRVRTGCRGQMLGVHGIKRRGYPGIARFSPPPPPRTVQAPLRAYGATQLAPWRGATGTAGMK